MPTHASAVGWLEPMVSLIACWAIAGGGPKVAAANSEAVSVLVKRLMKCIFVSLMRYLNGW